MLDWLSWQLGYPLEIQFLLLLSSFKQLGIIRTFRSAKGMKMLKMLKSVDDNDDDGGLPVLEAHLWP